MNNIILDFRNVINIFLSLLDKPINAVYTKNRYSIQKVRFFLDFLTSKVQGQFEIIGNISF